MIALLDSLEEPEPEPTRLGIDLAKHHDDVRCLALAYAMPLCIRNNWAFEDLLSDIYLKIATSNLGPNPFDPKRAKLSTYVCLVARSVAHNRWRRSAAARRARSATVSIDTPGLQVGYAAEMDEEMDAITKLRRTIERHGDVGETLVAAGGSPIRARELTGGGFSPRFARARRDMLNEIRAS